MNNSNMLMNAFGRWLLRGLLQATIWRLRACQRHIASQTIIRRLCDEDTADLQIHHSICGNQFAFFDFRVAAEFKALESFWLHNHFPEDMAGSSVRTSKIGGCAAWLAPAIIDVNINMTGIQLVAEPSNRRMQHQHELRMMSVQSLMVEVRRLDCKSCRIERDDQLRLDVQLGAEKIC